MTNQTCLQDSVAFDVTNWVELFLFSLILIFSIWLIRKIIYNVGLIIGTHQNSKPLQQIRNVNIILIIVVFCQIAQIIQELLFQTQKTRLSEDTIEIYSISFYVLTELKIFMLDICVLYSSKIWFKATQEINPCFKRQRRGFKYIYLFTLMVLPLLFVYLIIQYLFDCNYPWPRYFIQFLLSIVVFILFLYTITLFRRSVMVNPDIPNNFKKKLTRFTIILYLGVLVRTFFYLVQIIDTNLLGNIKQYDSQTMTDIGVGWFFFQATYQPLVNLYPMYFLSQIYSPQGIFNNNNQNSLIHDY